MKTTYYTQEKTNAVVKLVLQDDGSSTHTVLLIDPANTDYQKYLEWLAEGNEPLPADTQNGQNTASTQGLS